MNSILFETSQVFCMLPWTHMHVATNGNTFPCCLAPSELPLGNTHHHKLEELWNSERMRDLRKSMLEGRQNRICAKCYEQEASGFFSLRNKSNTYLGHHLPIVAETQPDGSLAQLNIAHLDIRFSNVCNFRCRTCGPEASTGWYRDVDNEERPLGVIRPKAQPSDLFEEIEPILAQVEQVFFAGGEPLLMEEHYRLLERLLERGRTDVRLVYATNLSTLCFAHWDVLKLWQRFPKVSVDASLDGSHARGEYIRKGQQWERTVENRKRQMVECPHVSFRISPTLSVLNCLHLPDFHQEWVELELLRPDQIQINILQNPLHFRLTTLPSSIKDRVRVRYHKHIRDFLTRQVGAEAAIRDYDSAIRFMEQDTSSYLPVLRATLAEQDSRRNESFIEVFPELEELFLQAHL